MEKSDQAKRRAKLEEIRRKRRELVPAASTEQGQGETGKRGRLLELLARRRRGNSEGGQTGEGGQPQRGLGGGLLGGGRNLNDMPLLKRALESRRGGQAGGGLRAGLGRMEGRDKEQIRARIKERIKKLQDKLEQLDTKQGAGGQKET